MTTYHRIVLLIADPEGRSMREIAAPIELLPDRRPRIISHEWREAAGDEDDAVLLPEMTPDEFEAWFYDRQPLSPSVQTVLSLIRVAEGYPGQQWLSRVIVPEVEAGRLTRALTLFAAYPDEPRSTLVMLAFDLIEAVLLEQNIVEQYEQKN